MSKIKGEPSTKERVWRVMLPIIMAVVLLGIIGFLVFDKGETGKKWIQLDEKQEEGSARASTHIISWGDFKKNGGCAWLVVPGIDVDNPVAISNDDRYLYQRFNGVFSFAGSLYMKERVEDGDFLTVVYGHDMIFGSMFGKISKFKDPSFMTDHKKFFFQTEDKVRVYTITKYVTEDDRDLMTFLEQSGKKEFCKRYGLNQDGEYLFLSAVKYAGSKRKLLIGTLESTETLGSLS